MNQMSKAGYFKFVLLVFLIVYLLIGLVNHYTFRTNAFDYGNYNQILYKLAHFQSPRTTVSGDVLFWADHFEPILYLLIPFYWIFGGYGLIIAQALGICLGGFGLFKFLSVIEPEGHEPVMFSTAFLSAFPVFGALESDYHSTILGVCCIPWLLWALKTERRNYFWIFLVLCLASRENLGLSLAFTLAPFLFEKIFSQRTKLDLGVAIFIGLSSFIVLTQCLMPRLDSERISTFQHLQSYQQPSVSMLSAIFFNFTGNALFDNLKIEFLVFSLLAGWFICLLRPAWFIAYIPLVLEKFLHQDALKWGINSHYAMEGILILVLGVFFVWKYWKEKFRLIRYVPFIFLLLTISLSIRLMDKSYAYLDHGKLRFYQIQHYKRDFSVSDLHALLSPYLTKNSSISAQNNLVPMLSFRENIRLFPDTFQVNYIMYNPSEPSTYPIQLPDFKNKINSLVRSGKFSVKVQSKVLVVLERVKAE